MCRNWADTAASSLEWWPTVHDTTWVYPGAAEVNLQAVENAKAEKNPKVVENPQAAKNTQAAENLQAEKTTQAAENLQPTEPLHRSGPNLDYHVILFDENVDDDNGD